MCVCTVENMLSTSESRRWQSPAMAISKSSGAEPPSGAERVRHARPFSRSSLWPPSRCSLWPRTLRLILKAINSRALTVTSFAMNKFACRPVHVPFSCALVDRSRACVLACGPRPGARPVGPLTCGEQGRQQDKEGGGAAGCRRPHRARPATTAHSIGCGH